MKGLELSKRYYREYGEPMLRTEFPALLPLIAVGLAGSGSECFGFDDAISQDHDFEPGFCIFLPDEKTVDSRTAFALERAYAKLPKEFMGFSRAALDPVGGSRHGVIRSAEFFAAKTGRPDGQLSLREWCLTPEQALAEATNGAVFYDGLGQFTAIRERLSYLPEDVRRKKLAGNLLLMGQAGQYNYKRCIDRKETAAAQLAAIEFAKAALQAIFLLNRVYLPYYKWSFRALREVPLLSELAPALEYLISSGNEDPAEKQAIIEQVCEEIIAACRAQGLTRYAGAEAEGHAYAVNQTIADTELRNLHILFAI